MQSKYLRIQKIYSVRLDWRPMSEDGNCESSPAVPSSTPAVASTTLEPRTVMSSYMKQLLAEKQKLEEKAGPELQLTHRLLANGKFRPCGHVAGKWTS